jgi:hypothetical protein
MKEHHIFAFGLFFWFVFYPLWHFRAPLWHLVFGY